ncbi:MAG: YgfZ/GcvT domain-containing protein, partial [Bacteroidota bacterium]
MATLVNPIHKKEKAARNSPGRFLEVSARSLLLLEGKDGQDLLQRLSTNDVAKLEIGRVTQTILTNDKGKIVDVLSVIKRAENSLLLSCQTEGEGTRKWLEKYIIMEEATVTDVTSTYSHFLFYEIEEALPTLIQPSFSFPESWGNARVHHVIVPSAMKERLERELDNRSLKAGSMQEFTAFRVAERIPAFPNELSTAYNPLEAGLTDLVSFTKGCYIGQEVIARLDTYKKVQRTLVPLELEAPVDQVPTSIHDERE